MISIFWDPRINLLLMPSETFSQYLQNLLKKISIFEWDINFAAKQYVHGCPNNEMARQNNRMIYQKSEHMCRPTIMGVAKGQGGVAGEG